MANWPFHHNGRPTEIVRAEAEYLYDAKGKQILDASGGAIVTNIGHGRKEVVDAVAKSLENTGYVVPPWLTPEREELVETLKSRWLTEGYEHFQLTCSGSEGVECAIKIAAQYHAAKGRLERQKILKRNISYHGTTVQAMAVGGHELRKRGFEHILEPHPVFETAYPYRCPSDAPLDYYVEDFEKTLEKVGPESIAALISEPISGASGGAIVPPDGYWEAVSAICREHDILVIADEVMTGFGRTGTKFGHQHWDFRPDLVVGGKGLAGGYAAITVIAATKSVASALAGAGFGVMFHTFAAMPSACVAATKVLNIIEREGLVERAATMGNQLQSRLKQVFSNHPHVGEVRGKGLLQAVELVQDTETKADFDPNEHVGEKVVGECLRNGMMTYAGGNGIVNDVVLLGPPLTVSENQIERIVSTLSSAVDQVTLN